MNSMYYRFSLDMQSVQSQISLPVSLYDTARTLYMVFTDGGKPYSIAEGCLAKLTITRPSGSKLHEFCAIEGNTTAIYPFSQNENTAAEEGIHSCEVTLYGIDGKQITSPRFSMVVSDRVVNMDDNNGLGDDSIGIIDDIVLKEQERRVAESDRVSAEGDRISAEEARVLADQRRAAAYNKIEQDTEESISKILEGQERIMVIQEALIAEGELQERLSAVIDLQESYIGGDNE